jgi:hypothetical protein
MIQALGLRVALFFAVEIGESMEATSPTGKSAKCDCASPANTNRQLPYFGQSISYYPFLSTWVLDIIDSEERPWSLNDLPE